MILNLFTRHRKEISAFFLVLFYFDTVLAEWPLNSPQRHRYPAFHDYTAPVKLLKKAEKIFDFSASPSQFPLTNIITAAKDPFISNKTNSMDIGGPTQPEMQQFQSVNSNNMVDLFSGDFSYNIPLLDVGGYPINISYRSGISMDQEASWVGLGWNVNPGSITRNLRGIPDDFNGTDSIKKTQSVKPNKTIGVTAGADVEVVGLPVTPQIGANLGVFYNNYKGWGLENGLNVSLNSGKNSQGALTAGMSITNNTQEGLTIEPTLDIKLKQDETENGAGYEGNFSISAPYNTRSGLKGLQLSAGMRQFNTDEKNQFHSVSATGINSVISFASPTAPPQITMPYTSSQYSFTAKIGLENVAVHPGAFIKGYVTKQEIAPADTLFALPAYGYLFYQDGAKNETALMDFNREKELIYRDNPPVPHIAVPYYTYDAFSITGEGNSGMFRAYRGDIGFMFDHFIRSKDNTGRASIDLGFAPNLTHGGIDLYVNRAYTQNSAWITDNSMRSMVGFKQDSGLFQASYFRNPGEKAINSLSYYNALGGDDVVTAGLYQPGISTSLVLATNYLNRYRNKQYVGQDTLSLKNTLKPTRDKRTQVISYLNAQEASTVGLSKYIENYAINQFFLNNCTNNFNNPIPPIGTGLNAMYFPTRNFQNSTLSPTIPISNDSINHAWGNTYRNGHPNDLYFPVGDWPLPVNKNNFSVRWQGQIKAPVTGEYTFTLWSDDGVLLWINDSLVISNNAVHALSHGMNTCKLNLVKGNFYKIRLDYYQEGIDAIVELRWSYPGNNSHNPPDIIPDSCLYPPAVDSFIVNNGNLVLEKRVNEFRKSNHISEIDVLNTDGKRYVYGIPVYNLRQKEATFSVDPRRGNTNTGLVGYNNGIDNTTKNPNGQSNYFSSEEIPAYAHSFLLTGILSPDYVDLTGDGITDDDLGNAVKLNYSKICGIENPYKWRVPYITDSVTYNPALKTDNRDDKGNYVYGEKELWYLHSIESKTMVANFVLQNRHDLYAIDEAGNKIADSTAKCLKQIDLYNKADLMKNPLTAIPIKTVHFEYDSSLCTGVNLPLSDSGKLTLRKIWFTYNGNNKGKQNPYLFYYHPNNPSYNVKSYDRWGNFKDPLQNPGSSGTSLINNGDYPYALQDSATAAYNAGAWSLDSIFLPSGGSMKVDFESDDYAYVQNLRAMQMFKLLGLGSDSIYSHSLRQLYEQNGSDNLYVFVSVPTSVSTTADVFQKYLTGIQKLYFKLFVRMPDDQFGTGSEYVPCYATLDTVTHSYGRVNSNVIWLKVQGISLAGDQSGSYSPLAKAAIQFLRLNLPSKAYANSEGDNLDLASAIKTIFSVFSDVAGAFQSFDSHARTNGWAMFIDTSRTLVRLDNPIYKKYGGGHRVKRITIYDNWNHMTGKKTAKYGQEYIYTTQQNINGTLTTISSGVASYEPGLGGEENPFHQPIEYVESVTPLGPTTMGYSEEPLGEALFPAPSIGYSQVTVRTINYQNVKSANGYEQTKFYTAYDFPTYTDRTMLDPDNMKRYRPAIQNFLRINAKYFLTMSQGFKVELNDMHGKLHSQAYFAQTDTVNPITYTENFYKVVNQQVDQKTLSNTTMVMHPDGSIDTAAIIGKDMELMMDMRQQESVTSGANLELNSDMFSVGFPPFILLPSAIGLPQHEDNRFRAIATVKVIQRYGIVDSVVHIDKGSKISTKDLLYDSETGDVLLTRTKNEFDDPVYTFNYPSHWAYDGMGLAYQNIDAVFNNVNLKNGKILNLSDSLLSATFVSGDEILVGGRQKINTTINCTDTVATFS
ncbi:MAG TPA: PA14 domain-containing protein, partial [Puia sp.]|nr:PA14 domain-containing protein [Puia sp.]